MEAYGQPCAASLAVDKIVISMFKYPSPVHVHVLVCEHKVVIFYVTELNIKPTKIATALCADNCVFIALCKMTAQLIKEHVILVKNILFTRITNLTVFSVEFITHNTCKGCHNVPKTFGDSFG